MDQEERKHREERREVGERAERWGEVAVEGLCEVGERAEREDGQDAEQTGEKK